MVRAKQNINGDTLVLDGYTILYYHKDSGKLFKAVSYPNEECLYETPTSKNLLWSTNYSNVMKKFAFVCRAVLLYGTALYFIILLMIAESLVEINPQIALLFLFILLILLIMCKFAFKNEDLDDYKPKWFN